MYRYNYKTSQMNKGCRPNIGVEIVKNTDTCGTMTGSCEHRSDCDCDCKPEKQMDCDRKPEKQMDCDCKPEKRMDCDCKPSMMDSIADKALAMAYVPWQDFKMLYCEKEGWENGTIFMQLNLEFMARRCN